MDKILLLKEIYVEAFRNWRYIILENYFRIFSWICFMLLAITIYAFAFRVSTGFSFSNL
ncbi:DUF6747 family protein [Maribacter aestuarii]|uniref:DUF6747 family protein n=1 Tax=Maribacter aestuarii TaxID=1130723 RepID=UPI00322209F5